MKIAYVGIFIAIAFNSGAFISSPELRAYAANTVFSSDIVDGEVKTADIASGAVTNAKVAGNAISTSKINDGAVKSADIGDGEVTATDIGTDAVGAAELQGVTKLKFAECALGSNSSVDGTKFFTQECSVPGADVDDQVLASINANDNCLGVTGVFATADSVFVTIHNNCAVTRTLNAVPVSIIVYDR